MTCWSQLEGKVEPPLMCTISDLHPTSRLPHIGCLMGQLTSSLLSVFRLGVKCGIYQHLPPSIFSIMVLSPLPVRCPDASDQLCCQEHNYFDALMLAVGVSKKEDASCSR